MMEKKMNNYTISYNHDVDVSIFIIFKHDNYYSTKQLMLNVPLTFRQFYLCFI